MHLHKYADDINNFFKWKDVLLELMLHRRKISKLGT